MTFTDWLLAASALVTPVSVIAGAVYIRGQKDGDVASLKRDLDEVKKAIGVSAGTALTDARNQGAQQIRNDQLAEVLREVRQLRDDIIKFAQKLLDHERGCTERTAAQELRFSKIDRNIEHLEASIRNVALGENDRAREVSRRSSPT